ncbi:hypothetical protein U879_05400 [Defluviimonas sp. 20V17]|uniref:Alkylmercury lyase n=1 Tax=Allgaiera indica TaxID=765699 RepID=A0AAN5A2P7_9RHOB|nr:alkylmercury lyase family protein [Allgaiera indica]KDB04701.1 hypothetical protein U879_05400 [Defluviimonas sp. 20V17]GHE05933.1 hypothetical protein GCM10008024_38550 [Allgaiera indica]SDX80966.1 Alkylmercury lyase [Allgaiera indica]
MNKDQGREAPNRSLANSPKVDEAMSALLAEARLAARWSDLSPDVRAAHHRILRAYVEDGAPPNISEFPCGIGAELSQRDLVHIRDGKIALAYPFSTAVTDFTVRSTGVEMHAVCAIDALGVAAMIQRETEVSCLCPICRTPMALTVAADGLTITNATDPTARVWTGVMEVGSCAADSQCTSMRMFCSPEHLEVWRSDRPGMRGFDLTLEEGVQLGAEIFRAFLREAAEPGPEAIDT